MPSTYQTSSDDPRWKGRVLERTAERSTKYLKTLLRQAVRDEDYELAATLRDELKLRDFQAKR